MGPTWPWQLQLSFGYWSPSVYCADREKNEKYILLQSYVTSHYEAVHSFDC